MMVNLLLLRGNMGKGGAGIPPVRGHSNVQGQRTVGISEKPELVPLGDYAQVRHAIERTWPATFKQFDERLFTPGGIERPLAARERKWNTRTGKANFKTPTRLFGGAREQASDEDVLQLTTFRSNDQFNTRFTGIMTDFALCAGRGW